MMYQLLKRFTDFIYGTQRVREKFEYNNPDEQILAADASKSIVTSTNERVQRGFDWVNSQRAVVILTDKRIICGKWIIPLETIISAELIKIGSGQVLKIHTKDNRHYQFGMQYSPEWINQQFLPLKYSEGKIKYSTFSIIIRMIVIGYIIYWIYARLFSK